MKTDNLFGICDNDVRVFAEPRRQAQAASCVKEKRWAVCGEGNGKIHNLVGDYRSEPGDNRISSFDTPENNTVDMLPPLDIITVWHSFMLNPRVFLEDCLRHRKMGSWATGLRGIS